MEYSSQLPDVLYKVKSHSTRHDSTSANELNQDIYASGKYVIILLNDLLSSVVGMFVL